MKYEAWARSLPGFVADKPPYCKVICPLHADRNPSMSIKMDTGFCHCFAGCIKDSAEELCRRAKLPDPGVRQAEEETGEKKREKPDAEYIYPDLKGQPYYKVLRYSKPHKRFAQAFVVDGKWSFSAAKGRKTGFPLFNLPGLAAADPARPVLFVEGEKDALSASALGLLATTAPMGAGKASYVTPELWALFRGRTVVLVPDQDPEGKRHMEDVARYLLEAGATVRWLDLAQGKDLTEWWALSTDRGRHNTRAILTTLKDLVDQAPTYTPPEPPPPELGLAEVDPFEFACTDLGNAELLVSLYGRELHYCTAMGWLVWDGKRWARQAELLAGHLSNLAARVRQKRAREMVASLEHETKAKEKQLKWSLASESRDKRNACLDQARTIPGVALPSEAFDASPWLLNVENGTIDLRTGKLGPHDRQAHLTRLAPVHFDADAQCPTWLAFLKRVMDGNDQLITYLQRATGYALSGNTGEHCFFLFYGTGRNGKGTFIETIQALLGDYSVKADFETFLNKSRGDGPRNDLARLLGARFVHSSEADEGRRLAEALIKELTGGDTITARFLHKEFFDFRPEFKLFLAANYKPTIRGTDEGIWSRVHLVPWTVTIPEEERDHELPEKLRAELPGILAWAVQGCLQWQQNGLKVPTEVRASTANYRSEMDVMGAFLGEFCVLSPKLEAPASKLYKTYQKWAEEQGEFVWTQTMFGRKLSERGLERVRTMKGIVWRGIGLVHRDEDLYQGEGAPAEGDDNPFTRAKPEAEALPSCSEFPF